MQIIGIDIGTTTISGAVLEYENEKTVKLLEAKTIENGGFMPTANEWEKIQDAGAIVKKAEKLLDDLLDKYPQTERIGLTGQMHGIVYIDQTGTCVSPLYTWQDGRGSLCEKGQCSLVQEIKEKCDLDEQQYPCCDSQLQWACDGKSSRYGKNHRPHDRRHEADCLLPDHGPQ